MAFTGRKNQPRKNRQKTGRCSSIGSPGQRQPPHHWQPAGQPTPDPLTPTGALCVPSACLMDGWFTATANRLRPIPPSCHAFSADKKRRVIKPQRPLTFPTKYCIKIQYRVHAIRPTASHLRRPAADGRVACHRAPSGAPRWVCAEDYPVRDKRKEYEVT